MRNRGKHDDLAVGGEVGADSEVDGQDVPGLTWRGYNRAGGGLASYVEPPIEFRGSSVQVCGLWPWASAGSSISIGVPLGKNLRTKATVCCDPIHWFLAKLITNPSCFIIANTGLGKSTLLRHMIIGLAGCGVVPIVLGDIRPDYRATVEALGGQIVEIGRGRGAINPLDLGALGRHATLLTEAAADCADPDQAAMLAGEAMRLRETAHSRSLNLTKALIGLKRKGPVTDAEDEVLSRALAELAVRHKDTDAPLLEDLDRLLENPTPRIMDATLARTDLAVYQRKVEALQTSVRALCGDDWGPVFNRQTTTRLRLDATSIDVDISSLGSMDTDLEAAVLLATWAEGYGAIEAANTLADAGLAPQRRFFIVLDELWKIVRTSMVDKIDQLTRLNRAESAGHAMITHSLNDLDSPADEADRAKARGFVERAGMVIIGGLPTRELKDLSPITYLSGKEMDMVAGWSAPRALSAGIKRDRNGVRGKDVPHGAGKFLLKVGNKPGIPVQVVTTTAENDAVVHDTNNRWNDDAPDLSTTGDSEPIDVPDLVVDLTEPTPIPNSNPAVPAVLVTVPSIAPASAAAIEAPAEQELPPMPPEEPTTEPDWAFIEVGLDPAAKQFISDRLAPEEHNDFDSDSAPEVLPAGDLAYGEMMGEDMSNGTYTRHRPAGRPRVDQSSNSQVRQSEPSERPPPPKQLRRSSGGGLSARLGTGRGWLAIPAVGLILVLAFVFVAVKSVSGSPNSGADGAAAGSVSAMAFQGAAIPVSTAAGPSVITDTSASGFAHSELGSALAALHLSVRTDPHVGPPIFTPAIEKQATGPTADVLALRIKDYQTLATAAKVTDNKPVISPTAEFLGWKIDNWQTDGPIAVHLLVQTPSGVLGDVMPTVIWDAGTGDYKMVLNSTGRDPVTKLTDPNATASFTKFMP